jgi:hypothetical protein
MTTRKTVIRTILAISMLPNVSAWRYLLPRKVKPRYWYRNAVEVLIHRKTSAMIASQFAERYRKFQMLRNLDDVRPISTAEFRLPIRTGNWAYDMWMRGPHE